jgi:hypothetical protein
MKKVIFHREPRDFSREIGDSVQETLVCTDAIAVLTKETRSSTDAIATCIKEIAICMEEIGICG